LSYIHADIPGSQLHDILKKTSTTTIVLDIRGGEAVQMSENALCRYYAHRCQLVMEGFCEVRKDGL
jgi:hypothetical protein